MTRGPATTPRAGGATEGQGRLPATASAGGEADESGLVALVDDDGAVRRALTRLLQGMGFDVVAFASAEAFLAAGDSRRFGCLLLDQQLGGMTGLELHARLVTAGEQVPTIFLTATDTQEVARARETPDLIVLTKPVDAAILQVALLRALAPGREQQAGRAARPSDVGRA